MVEYKYGDLLHVSPDATDNTGEHLFDEAGYGFDYLPPYWFRRNSVGGDLIVEDASGVRVAVSPQFVVPEAPLESDDDPVEHPAHYTRLGAEVIDISGYLNFPRGSAVKYLARAGHKEGADELEDLKKAQFFINWEIERIERERKEAL